MADPRELAEIKKYVTEFIQELRKKGDLPIILSHKQLENLINNVTTALTDAGMKNTEQLHAHPEKLKGLCKVAASLTRNLEFAPPEHRNKVQSLLNKHVTLAFNPKNLSENFLKDKHKLFLDELLKLKPKGFQTEDEEEKKEELDPIKKCTNMLSAQTPRLTPEQLVEIERWGSLLNGTYKSGTPDLSLDNEYGVAFTGVVDAVASCFLQFLADIQEEQAEENLRQEQRHNHSPFHKGTKTRPDPFD